MSREDNVAATFNPLPIGLFLFVPLAAQIRRPASDQTPDGDFTDRTHLPKKFSYRVLRWLLATVVAVHNFEEWLTIPTFGGVGASIAGLLT